MRPSFIQYIGFSVKMLKQYMPKDPKDRTLLKSDASLAVRTLQAEGSLGSEGTMVICSGLHKDGRYTARVFAPGNGPYLGGVHLYPDGCKPPTFQRQEKDAKYSRWRKMTLSDAERRYGLEDVWNYIQLCTRVYGAARIPCHARYATGIRGRKVKNGDLRLVIGVDKSRAWGMATFVNATHETNRPLTLRFKPKQDSSVGRIYTWEYTGMADSARSGPGRREIAALWAGDESQEMRVFENQALFVRTLNATLQKDGWENLESELGGSSIRTGTDINITPDIHSPGNPKPSDISASAPGGPSPSPHRGHHGYEAGSDSPSTSIAQISGTTSALRIHPSTFINNFLLHSKPDAWIAITSDRDWISVLKQDDLSLPPSDEILARITTAFEVSEADGVACLTSKDPLCSATVAATNTKDRLVELTPTVQTDREYSPASTSFSSNAFVDSNSKTITRSTSFSSENSNTTTLWSRRSPSRSSDATTLWSRDVDSTPHNEGKPFFQGAKNVIISGEPFNNVQGDYNVFDQSRHTSNVNSFNTTNNTTLESHNDNSGRYYGVNPLNIPPHRVPGQDQTSSATNGAPGVGGQYPDRPYAFPPPTVHPALMTPPVLPPGSRIQNFDSFNVQHGNINNTYNNSSKEYSAPPAKTRPRPNRRHLQGPQTGPQDAQDFWDEEEKDDVFSTSQNSHSSGTPGDPGKHSLSGDPRYANDQYGQYGEELGYNQRGVASSMGPPYMHTPESSRSNVQHTDMQVSPISQLLHTLGITREDLNKRSDQMRQFLTADNSLPPRVLERDNEYRARSGSDLRSGSRSIGSSSSLARSTSRASSSSLRDGAPPSPVTPVEPEPHDTEIPHRRMDPVIIGVLPSDANPYGSPTYPQQSTPLQAPNPADLSAFGLGATSPQLQGAPIFRNIHGDYTKIDNSGHTTNLGSSNTHNTLIKDSYNDNSFKSYAPAPRSLSFCNTLNRCKTTIFIFRRAILTLECQCGQFCGSDLLRGSHCVKEVVPLGRVWAEKFASEAQALVSSGELHDYIAELLEAMWRRQQLNDSS
ncbi:hypothetical protein BDZ97DRAFT_1765621 [Flammula alnicola]|nr:hypothetical protein BDZ97DRAFT_1765621 [Flammula alnicola]